MFSNIVILGAWKSGVNLLIENSGNGDRFVVSIIGVEVGLGTGTLVVSVVESLIEKGRLRGVVNGV